MRALRARLAPPRLAGPDGWTLELSGEPDYVIAAGDHDPVARAAIAARDGVDRVLVSLSSPLGIESLPGAEAVELLAAWHDGALALGGPFGVWAAAALHPLDRAALAAVAAALDAGCVGLQLPATALGSVAGWRTMAPLLALLAERDKPLFVHPGPAHGAGGGSPWWPAVVDYVAQMHAAWFARVAAGAPAGGVRVGFAMLAGLAPLHAERFAARAGTDGRTGGSARLDRDVFLETSSYGPAAIGAVAAAVGAERLVHGSDRPYAGPPDSGLGPEGERALRVRNPARLLGEPGS